MNESLQSDPFIAAGGCSPSKGLLQQADAEFRPRPSEGPSREEILREFDPPPPLPIATIPVAAPFQFSVFDLMIVMIGVAAGLAGGTWMPSDIFAALLGLVTLFGLALAHFFSPESHLAKSLGGTLVLAYIVAVAAAIFKGN